MSEKKDVDILSVKRKWQRDEGRFKAIKYFDNVKEEKLTWADIIFDEVQGGEENGSSPSIPTKPSASGVAAQV
jgi:hypothetical protein